MPPTETSVLRRSVMAVAQGMPPAPALVPAGTETWNSGSAGPGAAGAAGTAAGVPWTVSTAASPRPEPSA
ncbi:hypothetical protein [Streptomyces sp. NBC_00343]|uniref:hypothetical protein n=1 Tax=Streptomyces sp. NBC_00343 TaxID=2975719 RepID=UPI002E2C8728|nr:hypothetical protein [Streptomyces sp. NBC_00343]